MNDCPSGYGASAVDTTASKSLIANLLINMKGQINNNSKGSVGATHTSGPTHTKATTKKPRLMLMFKKPQDNVQSSNSNHSCGPPKRSSRRRSKQSVLQSAIARKEKSYNEANKPQRLTRQLKPTQKILDNLALAKQNKECGHGDGNHLQHSRRSARRLRRNASKGDLSESSDTDKPIDSTPRRSKRITGSNSTRPSLADDTEEVCEEPELKSKCENGLDMKLQPDLCLCTEQSNLVAALNAGGPDEPEFCTAVDSIDERLIGCSRVVSDREPRLLVRSSVRFPFGLYCTLHYNRLIRHNCCPTCGLFCTQGRFSHCQNKHQFHSECSLRIDDVNCCPHCGQPSLPFDINLVIKTKSRPVFLPVQKVQVSLARISFRRNEENDNVDDNRSVTPPLISIDTLKLFNAPSELTSSHEPIDLLTAIKDEEINDVAKILCSKSINPSFRLVECNDGTFLHYAAQNGHLQIIHMLIVSGWDMNSFDRDQNTALMLAIAANENEVVRYLVRAGASITIKGTDGMTALHLAAKCGNLRACEILLKSSHGNYVNFCDDGGWTALVWACEHGYADVANFLMFKGADPNIRDVEHNLALHWASFRGSSHIVELLLNKNCDVNAMNAHGDTPLHIAARQDMFNCAIVLLARGANVLLLNKNNENALSCAPPNGDCYVPISINISLQSAVDVHDPSRSLLINDISKGKESNPIQCVNTVDDVPYPFDFVYITSNCCTSDSIHIRRNLREMCSCTCSEADRCLSILDSCSCGQMSSKCWYDEDGKLQPDFNYSNTPALFECNDACNCNAITCHNRVVQRGTMQRFEVFRTAGKGWGVRTLRMISKGAFVAEYVGEILTDAEADQRNDDSYMFDLTSEAEHTLHQSTGYCIDSKFYGNFTRFINHSCNPNLVTLKVFTEHQDVRFPRVALFATRDIQPDEELGYDYGDKFWVAKYESFTCECLNADCRYSAATVNATICEYQRKLMFSESVNSAPAAY